MLGVEAVGYYYSDWLQCSMLGVEAVGYYYSDWLQCSVLGVEAVGYYYSDWLKCSMQRQSILQAMKTGVRADLGRRLFCGG